MPGYRAKLNLSVVPIAMEEVFAEYEKHSYEQNQWTELLEKQGYDAAELEKALWVYGALQRIVAKYGLSGVTVRCFDLLEPIKTTAAWGLQSSMRKAFSADVKAMCRR